MHVTLFQNEREAQGVRADLSFDELCAMLSEVVIADDKSDFSIDYAVVGLPESYLVDPDGIIVHKFIGGITKAEVEAVMADQGPATTTTVAPS